MPSADRLEEFVAIVDAGSVSAAARQLGLPRATLSRRLTGLEQELGVRLLHRETRRLALTDAGQALLHRARPLLEDTTAAWEAVARLDDTPRGRLRVAMPTTSLFHELLLGFATTYPEVELELVVSPRRSDLRAERVDVAFRFGPIADPTLVLRKLWTRRMSAVASPAYLDEHGRPRQPEDLYEHTCLLSFDEDWRRASQWPLRHGGQFEVQGRLVCDELSLRLHAALVGKGITLAPDPVSQPYLDSGQLELVLPEEIGGVAFASMVYPEREFLLPQVRAFIDHAVEHFADGMPPHPALMPVPVRKSKRRR